MNQLLRVGMWRVIYEVKINLALRQMGVSESAENRALIAELLRDVLTDERDELKGGSK